MKHHRRGYRLQVFFSFFFFSLLINFSFPRNIVNITSEYESQEQALYREGNLCPGLTKCMMHFVKMLTIMYSKYRRKGFPLCTELKQNRRLGQQLKIAVSCFFSNYVRKEKRIIHKLFFFLLPFRHTYHSPLVNKQRGRCSP